MPLSGGAGGFVLRALSNARLSRPALGMARPRHRQLAGRRWAGVREHGSASGWGAERVRGI